MLKIGLECQELESSHYVAKKLNINHKEINLFDNAANIMNVLPKIVLMDALSLVLLTLLVWHIIFKNKIPKLFCIRWS